MENQREFRVVFPMTHVEVNLLPKHHFLLATLVEALHEAITLHLPRDGVLWLPVAGEGAWQLQFPGVSAVGGDGTFWAGKLVFDDRGRGRGCANIILRTAYIR